MRAHIMVEIESAKACAKEEFKLGPMNSITIMELSDKLAWLNEVERRYEVLYGEEISTAKSVSKCE